MRFFEFFYFTRNDRIVVILLLVVAAVGTLLFSVMGGMETSNELTAADSTALGPARRHAEARGVPTSSHARMESGREVVLTTFDPNTADSMTLLQLGLAPWQVRNICRYRSKGGVYRRAEDFARLYGLTRAKYLQLRPYIRIGDDYLPAAGIQPQEEREEEPTRKSIGQRVRKLLPKETLPLNGADTTALKRVPGIGSYYARKIVDYRERLGGYHSLEQLMEIENFPEEALDYFTLSANEIKKINLNQSGIHQLRRHPYIRFFRAKAIVDYRRLKGPLRSLDDLKLLRDFPPEQIERLRPYAAF